MIIWLFAILTFATARTLQQQSIIICILKTIGFLAVSVIVTAVLELAMLGPYEEDENE